MAPLGPSRAFFVARPPALAGMSVLQPIHTSHVAFHAWAHPDPAILQGRGAVCLIEFDVFTCGSLSPAKVATVLDTFTRFEPRHADVTLLNRRWSLHVVSQDEWDAAAPGALPWPQWVRKRFR